MILERAIVPVFAADCCVLAAGPDEPALVVDPGVGTARDVLVLLRSHRLTLSATLLTHSHADHVQDSQVLIETAHVEGLLTSNDAIDVPIYIPERDHYRLEEPDITTGISANGMTSTDMASGEWRQPVDIRPFPGGGFSQAIEPTPGIALRVILVLSHSGGPTLFFFETRPVDNALLHGAEVINDDPATTDEERSYLMAPNGDVISKGSVGRIDLPGGDQVQMLATPRFLASAVDPVTTLPPGHGAVTTMEHEHHGNPYFVEARIREGDFKV